MKKIKAESILSTPTFTPTKTQANCIYPTNFPLPPCGGMTYANWFFHRQGINSIINRFSIYNDPGTRSALYLQLYDGSIDGTAFYFGVQTIHLIIFSRFGTTDLTNVRTGPGTRKVQGTNEGPFVSLRLKYDISVSTYTTYLQRSEFDGVGDWFDLYIEKDRKAGLVTYVGGIRFPRKYLFTPATLRDGGGTWIEFWKNNNHNTLYPVPFWHVGLFPPIANNQWSPSKVKTAYSAMPNSDTYFDKIENILHMNLGDSTVRCNPANEWTL